MTNANTAKNEIIELVRATYQSGIIDGKQGTNCEEVVVEEFSKSILSALKKASKAVMMKKCEGETEWKEGFNICCEEQEILFDKFYEK